MNLDRKTQVLTSSAKYLGLKPDEFERMTKTSASIRSELQKIAQLAADVASARPRSGSPDPNAGLVLESNRRAAITHGVEELHRSLPETAWKNLNWFINHPFRQHVMYAEPVSATDK